MDLDTLAENLSDMMSHLYDASIQSSMHPLGGCKKFDLKEFPAQYRKYVQNYVDQSRDASQCTMDYLNDNGYLFGVTQK